MNSSLSSLLSASYGFSPSESQHHFVVDIPRGSEAPIKISEHLTWSDETGSSQVSSGTVLDGQIRVILAHLKWDGIADESRTQFNLRLKRLGKKSGAWAYWTQPGAQRPGQGTGAAGLGAIEGC